MIVLPITKDCIQKKGVLTFDCSFSLPDLVGDSSISHVYLVGHYLGSSFRVDHKVFTLADAVKCMASNSVVFCSIFTLSKIL